MKNGPKSALFNFESLLVVILLIICSCAYIRAQYPALLDSSDGTHTGIKGLMWKAARIGERKSQYVAIACIAMGLYKFFA
jgi:hypothetical protein